MVFHITYVWIWSYIMVIGQQCWPVFYKCGTCLLQFSKRCQSNLNLVLLFDGTSNEAISWQAEIRKVQCSFSLNFRLGTFQVKFKMDVTYRILDAVIITSIRLKSLGRFCKQTKVIRENWQQISALLFMSRQADILCLSVTIWDCHDNQDNHPGNSESQLEEKW